MTTPPPTVVLGRRRKNTKAPIKSPAPARPAWGGVKGGMGKKYNPNQLSWLPQHTRVDNKQSPGQSLLKWRKFQWRIGVALGKNGKFWEIKNSTTKHLRTNVNSTTKHLRMNSTTKHLRTNSTTKHLRMNSTTKHLRSTHGWKQQNKGVYRWVALHFSSKKDWILR